MLKSQANGTDEKLFEEKQKNREAQLEQLAHQHGLQQDGKDDVEFLRELLWSELEIETIDVLDNYLSPDFVLSYMPTAGIEELKWFIRTRVRQVFWRHPQPESNLQGMVRAYAYDDVDDQLRELSSKERLLIKSYAEGLYFRAMRSREGFQQKKIGETTSRVERVDRDSEESDGGLGGLF